MRLSVRVSVYVSVCVRRYPDERPMLTIIKAAMGMVRVLNTAMYRPSARTVQKGLDVGGALPHCMQPPGMAFPHRRLPRRKLLTCKEACMLKVLALMPSRVTLKQFVCFGEKARSAIILNQLSKSFLPARCVLKTYPSQKVKPRTPSNNHCCCCRYYIDWA